MCVTSKTLLCQENLRCIFHMCDLHSSLITAVKVTDKCIVYSAGALAKLKWHFFYLLPPTPHLNLSRGLRSGTYIKLQYGHSHLRSLYFFPSLYYYLLTPWSMVILEKLASLQLVKKFPAFYGTRRFLTALTSARHLSLS